MKKASISFAIARPPDTAGQNERHDKTATAPPTKSDCLLPHAQYGRFFDIVNVVKRNAGDRILVIYDYHNSHPYCEQKIPDIIP